MFPLFINPVSILLTLTTSFGVIIHDTQIDRATTAAFAVPAIIATFGVADITMKSNDPHIHVERFSAADTIRSLKSGQPRTQTRDDDKEFMAIKKYVSDGVGSEYNWPSV